ncbi:MAG: TIGR01777 family oxidoreductase [Pseudomonadota bacterium]|nr:TIGR01777 family oxidoreductase [Pseudomonadota bacterium]
MNYLITGGTGLIGSKICQKLQAAGHTVIVLSRSRDKVHRRCGLSAIAVTSLDEIGHNEQVDVVINLAGAPIADARWTQKRKQELKDSRIKLTEELVEWIARRQQKPASLISGSAIGWYGDQGETALTEQSGFRDEFAHELCDQWEQAALKAQQFGVRVCLVRTGLVLAPRAGFLQRMLLPFKLGMGGPISDGQQYMSWVHLEDISNLFIFLSKQATLGGVFNGTAPTPVTNAEFSRTLAQNLHRPAFMVVPACVLKLAFGEMSQLLLGGQRVLPEKARAAGFEFQYTDLNSALGQVLQ